MARRAVHLRCLEDSNRPVTPIKQAIFKGRRMKILRPFCFLGNCTNHGGSKVSVPAAYIGIILIWSTTPLAIQWSGTEVGYLFGITSRMMLGSQALGPQAAYGIAGMLFSVTAYSASAVAIKRINADVPALATTVGGLIVTVPLLIGVYVVTGEPLPAMVPPRAIMAIVYLGVIGSVLGFALYYYVLKHVDTTRVALITVITPVIALMLGHLLNGEAIQTEALIGTAAILSGLLLFEYGQKAGKWVRDTMIG
jgi:drug/metabolite transporter (DMT)-like permease